MAFTLNNTHPREKIVITSPQQCIDLLNGNLEDNSYYYYLVGRYLQDNFELFTKKELDILLLKKELIEKFGISFAITLFKKAIKDDKPMDNYHQRWFKLTKIDKSKNKEMLIEYLALLDKHNNKEQLELLFIENQNLVQEYYQKTEHKSAMLHQIVLSKLPHNIIYNKDYTEIETIEWMKKNIHKLKNIHQVFSQYSSSLRKELYKVLINYYKNDIKDFFNLPQLDLEDLSIQNRDIIDNLQNLQTDFFEYFKKIEPDLLKKIFSIQLKNIPIDMNKFVSKINLYQYLILHNNNCNANFLMIDKELAFQPIAIQIDLYEKENIDFVEYCFEHNYMEFLIKVGQNLQFLDKKHQKIIMAFELNYSINKGRLSSLFTNCDITMFNDYLKIIPEHKIVPSLKKEINSLLLKYELESSLTTKSLKTTKIKI